jgi:hypothetical protein
MAGDSPRSGGDAGAAASAAAPQVTRVFYLQGMEPREAVTLFRAQAQVRRVAMIADRSVVVVSDIAEKVEQAESLLRQRDAVARTSDPHQPLELLAESPAATRTFRVDGDEVSTVLTVLRSIYQVRELSELADGGGVEVRAAQPILDSSAALLRELGLLAGE